MTRLQRYTKNALILVLASLFMRGVSLAFHAYVSREIGAEGMGLFSLSMSVYGFAVTFATSGISLAVTRLVAAAIGANEADRVRAILRRALLWALFFGGVASVCLFSFARPIGLNLLRDARTVPSLRLLSVSLVPIALSSVLSGYFTAVRRVYRGALAQLFEQGLRIALTSYLLLALLPKGIEYACLALVGGSAIAEFSSFFFILIQYLIDRKKHRLPPLQNTRVPQNAKIWGAIAHIALPIAASAYVRSGLVTVEHILIPIALGAGGAAPDEALASYGVLHSMAIPLVLFPAAITSAFSSLLVPEIAESAAAGEGKRIRHISERAIRATLLFAILAAAVLLSSASEIGQLFYHSDEAGRYIRLLAPVVVLMYLDTTVDAILKGLGYQVYSMFVNIADSLLSILLVLLLLPRMGAVGYVLVVILAELFNLSLSLLRLLLAVSPRIPLFCTLVAPTLAAVGAATLAFFLFPATGTMGNFLTHAIALSVLYVLLLFPLGVLGGKSVSLLFSTLFPLTFRKRRATMKEEKRKKEGSQ